MSIIRGRWEVCHPSHGLFTVFLVTVGPGSCLEWEPGGVVELVVVEVGGGGLGS